MSLLKNIVSNLILTNASLGSIDTILPSGMVANTKLAKTSWGSDGKSSV